MPEGETVGKQKCKLEREVRPHHLKAEWRVEVDNNRAVKYGLGRTASRIKSNDRRPANLLNEPLLERTPSIAYVPAKPWPIYAGKSLPPGFSGLKDGFERNVESFPIPLPKLRLIHGALLSDL